jgi:dTMP kinase
MSHGVFLTFEGIEGCGKSTQARSLAEALRGIGHNVLHTREPGGPVISERIRTLLLNPDHAEMTDRTELLLYMASRAQHTAQWIRPALERGDIVICDRYVDSSLAYQGGARGLGSAAVRMLARFATQNLTPDHTFLLDIPAEVGLQRIAVKTPDRLESESLPFHRRVRAAFLRVAKREPARFSIIDSLQPIDRVGDEILTIAKRLLQRNQE